MDKFDFCFDTHFVFEPGAEKRAGEFCKKYGRKVLLLDYSEGSEEQVALHASVKGSLEAEGLTVISLDDVVPNPLYSTAKKAIEVCKEENVEVILAVGGGSVIDSAKCISVGAVYGGDVWQDFYVNNGYPEKWLPLIAIPTIAAAGSEGSVASILVDDASSQKFSFKPCPRPAVALINPALCYTVPDYHTACGAADIMSHAMERYFTNTPQCDLTDGMIEGLLRAVIKNAPVLMEDPKNYDARAELSWAAVLSQCDLLNTGRESDWSCHNIEHTLAEFYHKPHGAGLAITTPAWMKFVYRHDVDRFVQFAVRVWGIAEDSGTPEDIALKGIKALKDFFKSLGLDVCLKDLGAGDENCKAMAQACFKKYGTLGHFVKLNEPDLYQIYLNMVE